MSDFVSEAAEGPRESDSRRIRELERQLAAERAKRTRAEHDLQAAESIAEHQKALLEKRSQKLFRSPRSRDNVKGGHYHRLLIPDTHGAHVDKTAAAAFLADLEFLSPREVVWMGDHLDCGGFLAQHHTLGFVPETAVEWPDDIAACNEFMDEVQKRTPKAVHYFLTGNHEHRIERWCIQAALAKERTAQYFLDHHGCQAVLHLEARGMHYIPRGQKSANERVRGAIKLGMCWFVHDVSTAKNAAQVALNRWSANVCFGDTHRIDMAVGRKAERDIIAATNGCLSTLQPYWMETNVTDWSHAYGVQVVANGGEFLHIIVPIIGKRSMLGPLLGAVK